MIPVKLAVVLLIAISVARNCFVAASDPSEDPIVKTLLRGGDFDGADSVEDAYEIRSKRALTDDISSIIKNIVSHILCAIFKICPASGQRSLSRQEEELQRAISINIQIKLEIIKMIGNDELPMDDAIELKDELDPSDVSANPDEVVNTHFVFQGPHGQMNYRVSPQKAAKLIEHRNKKLQRYAKKIRKMSQRSRKH